MEEITVPKTKRGGSRSRNSLIGVKKSKSGSRMLIYELVRYYGGLTKITQKAAEILDEPDFSIQNFSNWRGRGWVTFEFAMRLAKELGVNVYALNYKDATRILGPGPSWKQAVQDCKVFTAEVKKEILKYEAPKL